MQLKSNLPSRPEEIIEALAKGAISFIPFGGPLLAELGVCLVSPLEKRRREWYSEVEVGLAELNDKFDLIPSALVEDPRFISGLVEATKVALSTHRLEKRAALREFLVAVGARVVSSEELQQAFVRLIDELSAGHMELLQFLRAEVEFVSKAESLELIYQHYEKQGGALDRMTFRLIVAGLESRMVVHLGDIEDLAEYASKSVTLAAQNSGVRCLQVTALGEEFLRLLNGELKDSKV